MTTEEVTLTLFEQRQQTLFHDNKAGTLNVSHSCLFVLNSPPTGSLPAADEDVARQWWWRWGSGPSIHPVAASQAGCLPTTPAPLPGSATPPPPNLLSPRERWPWPAARWTDGHRWRGGAAGILAPDEWQHGCGRVPRAAPPGGSVFHGGLSVWLCLPAPRSANWTVCFPDSDGPHRPRATSPAPWGLLPCLQQQ